MQINEYQALAMRTAKDMGSFQMDLIHASLGISGEGGEFADAVKKHAVYNKQLDVVNCVEELGDLLWYVALAAEKLGVSLEEIMQRNIAKLQVRYPEKYSDAAAVARADKVA